MMCLAHTPIFQMRKKVPAKYAVQILDLAKERKKRKSGLFILVWSITVVFILLRKWSVIEK